MIYITGDTHGDLSHFKDPKLKRLGEKDMSSSAATLAFFGTPTILRKSATWNG